MCPEIVLTNINEMCYLVRADRAEGAHIEIRWREAPTEREAREVILRSMAIDAHAQWIKRSPLVFPGCHWMRGMGRLYPLHS